MRPAECGCQPLSQGGGRRGGIRIASCEMLQNQVRSRGKGDHCRASMRGPCCSLSGMRKVRHMASLWKGSIVPAFSTTQCTATSGRSCSTSQQTVGTAKNKEESGPPSPWCPPCREKVVSCWQGEPATTRSAAPSGTVRRIATMSSGCRTKSQTSSAAGRQGTECPLHSRSTAVRRRADLNGPRGHEPAILHLCRGRVEAKPSRADAVEKGQEHKWLADVAVRSAAALNDCPRPDDGRDVPRLVKVNNPVGGPVKGSQGSPIGECFGQDLGRPKIASPDGGRVRERGGPPLLVDNGAHAVIEEV